MLGLLVWIYVIIIFLSVFGIKRSDSMVTSLDKNSTLSMRGAGMLLIVMVHAVSNYVNIITFFYYVTGVAGVSICFLVSGYGITKQKKQKRHYMKHFLIIKFARCLIPYAITYILYLIILYVQGNLPPLGDTLHQVQQLQIDGCLFWYLKVQLLMYIFYYIVYRWNFVSEKLGVLLISALTVTYVLISWRLGMEEYWYNTCYFFAIGILLSIYEDKILAFCRSIYGFAVSAFLAVIMFAIIFKYGRVNLEMLIDGIYMLGINMLIIRFFSFYENAYFLKFLGKLSMEIYLIHILILKLNNTYQFFDFENGVSYLLLLLLSILCSLPIYGLSNICMKKLRCVVNQKHD